MNYHDDIDVHDHRGSTTDIEHLLMEFGLTPEEKFDPRVRAFQAEAFQGKNVRDVASVIQYMLKNSNNLNDLVYFGINPNEFEQIKGAIDRNTAAIVRNKKDDIITSDKILQIYQDRKQYCVRNWKHAAKIVGMQDDQSTQDYIAQAVFQNFPVLEDNLPSPDRYKIFAEQIIQERIVLDLGNNIPPISYDFVFDWLQNDLLPITAYNKYIEFNKNILNGGTTIVFCCPDYSKVQLPDGSFKYLIDSVGTGPGLTAERTVPLVTDIIKKNEVLVINGEVPIISFRIANGDFEANEISAAGLGLSSEDEFEAYLNESLNSIIQLVASQFDSFYTFELQTIEQNGEMSESNLSIFNAQNIKIANIEIGRVTKSFPGVIEDKADFMNKVEEVGEFFVNELNNPLSEITRQANNTLATRLHLMINWTRDEKLTVPPKLEKIYDSELDEDGRKKFVQSAIEFANQGDNECAEFITRLQRKVVMQGAEYFVMAWAMGQNKSNNQIFGDSKPLWDAFGNTELYSYRGIKSARTPRIGRNGNYLGA